MTSIRQQLASRIREYDDAQAAPLFAEVADSGQLDDVLNNMNVTDGCYVIKLDNPASDESEYYQRITQRYQIVTICQNFNDAYGTAAGDVAEAMQRRVFAAISGYVATTFEGAATDPVKFTAGGLVDLKNHRHVWSDIYQLEFTQTINQQ